MWASSCLQKGTRFLHQQISNKVAPIECQFSYSTQVPVLNSIEFVVYISLWLWELAIGVFRLVPTYALLDRAGIYPSGWTHSHHDYL
jgi:hypothetical protein